MLALAAATTALMGVLATDVTEPSTLEFRNIITGCVVGGVAGGIVGTMPVITVWGTVVAPYSVPQAAAYGCLAGMAVEALGTVIAAEITRLRR